MKKNVILSVVALSCFGALFGLTNSQNGSSIKESTIDFVNEENGIEKVNIRKAATTSKFDMSKTYVQWAHNEKDGCDYLRFATAISGDYTSITYTRKIANEEDAVSSVTSVYKAISSAGKSAYYNGDDLRDLSLASTKDYYWACYTIKFVTDEFKASDITVSINVDGNIQSRTSNLTELKREHILLGDALQKDYNLTNLTTIKERFYVGSDNELYGLDETLPEGVTQKFGLTQGMTTDGKNIYYLVTNNKQYNIYKYDPSTGEHTKVMATANDGQGSSDLHGLKYIDNYLYPVDSEGHLTGYAYNLNVNGWSGNKYKEYFGTEETYAIRDFVRNPVNKKIAVLSMDGVFKFYDADLTYLEGKDVDASVRPTSLSTGTVKSLDCDDKYIYALYVSDGYHGVRLAVYDWSGNYVTSLQYGDSNLYPHNNSSKVATFTIAGQKLYLGSISWSGQYHSELYSYDFNYMESSRMGLSEILDKSSLYGIDASEYSFNEIAKLSANGLTTIQSACSDGERYIYYALNDASNTTTTIVKFDTENNSVVGYTPVATISDVGSYSDTSNLFFYNGKVYLIGVEGSSSKLYSCDVSNIIAANTSEIVEDTILNWFPDVGRNGSVAYNPTLKVFLISNSSGAVNKYSEDGTLLTSTSTSFTLGGQGIGLTTDGNNVYYTRSGQLNCVEGETTYAYDSIIIQRLDWNLNKIGAEYELGSPTNIIGEKTVGRGSNMQAFIELNGRLFAGRLVYQKKGNLAGGAYIYEVNYNCKEEISKFDTSYTLGEHIETNLINSTTASYSLIGEGKNVGGTYLQGAVTVGDHIYYTSGNNKECVVGKYDPYTKTAIQGTTKFTLHSSTSGDYGKIFYYDDTLWLIDSSGNFIAVDIETLSASEKTLTLTNLPSGVKALDAGYSETSNTLVVLSTSGDLYFFDEELNLINTVTDAKPTTGSLYSLTVSGNYIYVNANKDAMNGVGLRVYDINGNEIADTSVIVDAMGIASTMKACKILDFNGIAIITALGWNPTTGCYFYHINLK